MGEAQLLTPLVSDDPDQSGHAARVTTLALRLAEAVGADPQRIEAIRLGAPLHDIGKLALDPQLLRKPGPLAPDELDQIRSHPERGVQMLNGDETLHDALTVCSTTTSGGTAAAIRTASPARRSRSRPASSLSPTPTTR